VRAFHFDDYLYGKRIFLPTDRADPINGKLYPSGDGAEVPLGYTHEWSGALKLTNRNLSHIEVNYQAILNSSETRSINWNYVLNPDGDSRQDNFALSHGLDWIHTLGASRYYNLSVRQNLVQYQDQVYASAYDSSYDAAGQATGYPNFFNGLYVQGVNLTRFKQYTNALLLKGAFVDQRTKESQFKVGGEAQWSEVEFGPSEYLVYTTLNGQQTLIRHVNEPPKYPLPATYHPFSAAGYGQEQLEWNDLTLRAGLRLDVFDANSTVPSDLANPANSISGAPQSTPVPTTTKVSLSPRIGVSFPISSRSGMYFAYGHFYQMPALGVAFSNADYNVLSDLQASSVSYGILGNPDIRPEKTVQYQAGYKQAVTDDIGLDLTLFYKDIRDLLGVEFISTYNDAEYARYTNVDFGTVLGFTVAFDWRTTGAFSMNMDYTWQTAQGNASDPRETATRAEAGQDPRPRQIPFDWDQRHTLNLQFLWNRPAEYSVSAIVRAGSGLPYTPQIDAGFGGGLEDNSGRKPAGVTVDLRADKSFEPRHLPMALFVRVFNLFDTRYFNGFVFANSGSPYYSRYPVADAAELADPTRYFGPRRVEAGVTLNRQ
jgi:outer membrane receptor protein involved in Fe transport